jgi:hypothetical protein
MGFQRRKHCPVGGQGINGINGNKIMPQIAKLEAYCSFYFQTTWLLLFGDIKKSSTCLAPIMSGLVLAKI